MTSNNAIWQRCLDAWFADTNYQEVTRTRPVIADDKPDMIFTDNTRHTARVLNNLYGDPIETTIPTSFTRTFVSTTANLLYLRHPDTGHEAICENVPYDEAVQYLNDFAKGE